MSGGPPPWPVAVVTGMLGSGKTTMIGRLLRHAAMADTLVLVNEFGEVGLDHALIRAVTDNVVLLANGCLCCTIRSDVVQTLRELHRAWLAGTIPDFGRVLVETTGLAEPAPLIGSLVSNPLLVDAFRLETVSTVVDAQHGLRQLAERPTCRNQVCMADRLLVSKADLAGDREVERLEGRLRALNPIATLARSDLVDPDLVFRRDASPAPRAAFLCDEASDHLGGISTVLLRARRPLSWARFRVWLGELLDRSGAQVLRLKGRLTFDASERSMVIQAVHHTFYPIVEAPPESDDDREGVLILDGPVDRDTERHLGRFGGLEIG